MLLSSASYDATEQKVAEALARRVDQLADRGILPVLVRDVPRPPFDLPECLLANPDRHHEIDASGMVGDDEDASPITKVGQVFRMNMTSVNGSAVRYQVDNHVTQFQPNRRIAWEVGLVDGERLGWTWCYDLEPHGDDKSDVSLTYDWSGVSPEARAEHEVPVFGPDQLAASLDLLDSALRKS